MTALRLLLAAGALCFAQDDYPAGELTPREAYRRVHTGAFDLDAPPSDPPAEVELGGKLFFDERLSAGRAMSCATCHDPAKAWTDGRRRAKGRRGELRRNTPSLLNVRRSIQSHFFWDGRARTLEDAIKEAMTSRLEMAADDSVVAAAYPGLTVDAAAKALAAFVRSQAYYRATAFDRFADDEKALSPRAQRGLVLFVGKARCLHCHSGAYLSDDFYHRVGLKEDPADPDPGRFAADPDPAYWRAFKTPPLRGVAQTAPYMHDGRFAKLADVVEFYDRGGDDADRDPTLRPLALTADEKRDLVAFLEALNFDPEPVMLGSGRP